MTDEQKIQIKKLKAAGLSNAQIAQETGILTNTVKSFCRRHKIAGDMQLDTTEIKSVCKNCGIPVKQQSGRKEKKFCSDKCRMKWWNAHLNEVNRKAMSDCICKKCGKHFYVYGKSNRKYCSHECYISDRFGGDNSEQ